MSVNDLELQDLGPERAQFLAEAAAGLRRDPKELPCKYFYDERGSALFDRICELEEYYPTRTELSIMDRHAGEMAARIGARSMIVEFGSGSSLKTRVLLDAFDGPMVYVPVDISREHLVRAAGDLASSYPAVEVLPVCADFTRPFPLPQSAMRVERRTIYFPGSTIGNFAPPAARRLLAQMAAEAGKGGAVLIGVDLRKDPATLERAYDDASGVTAEFNRNLLRRMNRELGSDFDLDAFAHRAVWNGADGRIEMHLVSKAGQTVQIGGDSFAFAKGESIRTECSYKWRLDDFRALAAEAGLRVEQVWTDERGWFSVQYLAVT